MTRLLYDNIKALYNVVVKYIKCRNDTIYYYDFKDKQIRDKDGNIIKPSDLEKKVNYNDEK